MTTAIHILSVCGDPGGAVAVAPVLRALSADQRFCVHSHAYRHGVDRLLASDVETGRLPEDVDQSDCRALLESCQTSLLLAGTSMNGADLEQKFIVAARELGIPSLCVLDFWANYRGRFADAEGRLAFLPNRIAIMDERARSEMLGEGFADEMLVVTGQPAFDALTARRRAETPEQRSKRRRALGVGDDDLLVVFASQALIEICLLKGLAPDAFGFTEFTVLSQAVATLEMLSREHGRRIVLLVRPHAREPLEKFREIQSNHEEMIISRDGELPDVMLAADMVVSMNSVALVEACYLGVVAVSLQPGLVGPDMVPTNRAGLSRPVYDGAGIAPAIAELLFDAGQRAAHLERLRDFHPETGATARVLKVVEEMLALSPGLAAP